MKSRTILFLLFTLFSIVGNTTEYKFEYYIDTANLTFEEVQNSNFTEKNNHYLHNDNTSDTYWVRITPQTEFSNNDWLSLANSYNNVEEVFLLTKDSIVKKFQFGSDQEYQSLTFLPGFELNSNLISIYIKVKSNTFLLESFDIKTNQEHFRFSFQFTFLMTFMFCLFLFVFVHVIIVYKKTGRQIYKQYSWYIASLFLFMIFLSNWLRYLIRTPLPFSYSYVEGALSLLLIISYTWLTFNVTEMYRNHTIFKKLLFTFYGISVALTVFGMLISNPRFVSQTSSITPLFGFIFILTFSIIAVINNRQHSKLYLIGILAFLGGTVTRVLVNNGMLKYSIQSEIICYTGIIVEIIIFTFVISKYVDKRMKLNEKNERLLLEFSTRISNLKLKLEESEQRDTPEQKVLTENINDDINKFLLTPLTNRELEVLKEMASGGKYAEISERMFISINTLKSHIAKIYIKLDTENRIDAINKAMELSNK